MSDSSKARLIADSTGAGAAGGYTGGAFHGFFVDSEGKLIYDKVNLSDNDAVITLTDGSVFDDPVDFTKGSRNDADRKAGEFYDQWVIDSLALNFYLNDNGFLVAVINEPYTYSGPN